MKLKDSNHRNLFFLILTLSVHKVSVVAPPPKDKISNLNQLHDEDEAKSSRGMILDHHACANEIPLRCEGNRAPQTDLEALTCILNKKRDEMKELKESCNHQLWLFRNSLMHETNFYNQLHQNCILEIHSTNCSKDPNPISCIVDNKAELKSDECRDQISLVARVMFSDYAVIGRFTSKCENDIRKLNCGRIEPPNDELSPSMKFLETTQGKTIECLSKSITEIKEECAIEILRVAELQADDYHLDRALYFACRDDRETFCRDISAGGGKVFRCLLENKMEERMSSQCREQLLRRQQLGAQDYKVTGIPFACKSEIKKFKCRKGADSDKHVRLSQILLCLEGAGRNGQGLNGECVTELKLHRKSLMEDHKATPELLADCRDDYKKLCPNSKPVAGKTIHCLMAHALSPKKSERITDKCRARLEDLLKITDVSENWNVDPVLKEACQPVVVESSCRDVSSKEMMSCLMSLLTSGSPSEGDENAMTDECESNLLQIQYFLTRDFKLGSKLYEECKKDAEIICGMRNDDENENEGPNRGPLLLSCLYRNYQNSSSSAYKVSSKCGERVKEAMRERALLVRLNPELENFCLEDLSDFCSERTRPGEEIECLQDHVDAISTNCRSALLQFTDMEEKDPSIDPFLHKYCGDFIERCSQKLSSEKNELSAKSNDKNPKKEDESFDDVFECLVKLKPEIRSKKCKVRLEHMQLLQLRHFDFSPKFKTLCYADVVRRCKNTEHMTSSKLVLCLSENIWNDTLHDRTHRISKPCRKQVKFLTLSSVQMEDSMSEGTYSSCKGAISKYCGDIKPGGGRILECLRKNREKIGDRTCIESLFPLQQSLSEDSNLDVFLKSECAIEIRAFCSNVEKNDQNPLSLINCLKLNKDQEGFDGSRCGSALKMRLIESSSDMRLNFQLRSACSSDIQKWCYNIRPGGGRVFSCLKEKFILGPKSPLSSNCKNGIEGMIKGGASNDIRYDYSLYHACAVDIRNSCKSIDLETGDKGSVEECLKKLYHERKIESKECAHQVTILIQATEIDIHIDPLLHKACALDLIKRCDGIPPGDGRLVSCLLNVLDNEDSNSANSKLRPLCAQLLHDRSELFKLAGSPSGNMDSLQELYTHVKESKNVNYFLVVGMSLLATIFLFGLFCGRATKRKAVGKDI